MTSYPTTMPVPDNQAAYQQAQGYPGGTYQQAQGYPAGAYQQVQGYPAGSLPTSSRLSNCTTRCHDG